MPVHSAWMLLVFVAPHYDPGEPVHSGLAEGQTCTLVQPLEVQDTPGAPPRRLEPGQEIRIVRPQADETDVLAGDRLATTSTDALELACRFGEAQPEQGARTPAEALALAEQRFVALRFAEALAPLREVLAHPTTDSAQRRRAYELQGSALAVMGYTIEAESAFRTLLTLDPQFRPHAKTSPKVASVFERVAREVEALRRQESEARRAEMLAELKVSLANLDGAQGGQPLFFDVTIRDPRGVVEEARAYYREAGEPAFASVALTPTETGRWVGELPAAFTANEAGFQLEYYVGTFDEHGDELTFVGVADRPLAARIAPGQVPSTPFYKTVWFWGVLGGSAAAVSVLVAGTAASATAFSVMPPIVGYPAVFPPFPLPARP